MTDVTGWSHWLQWICCYDEERNYGNRQADIAQQFKREHERRTRCFMNNLIHAISGSKATALLIGFDSLCVMIKKQDQKKKWLRWILSSCTETLLSYLWFHCSNIFVCIQWPCIINRKVWADYGELDRGLDTCSLFSFSAFLCWWHNYCYDPLFADACVWRNNRINSRIVFQCQVTNCGTSCNFSEYFYLDTSEKIINRRVNKYTYMNYHQRENSWSRRSYYEKLCKTN